MHAVCSNLTNQNVKIAASWSYNAIAIFGLNIDIHILRNAMNFFSRSWDNLWFLGKEKVDFQLIAHTLAYKMCQSEVNTNAPRVNDTVLSFKSLVFLVLLCPVMKWQFVYVISNGNIHDCIVRHNKTQGKLMIWKKKDSFL